MNKLEKEKIKKHKLANFNINIINKYACNMYDKTCNLLTLGAHAQQGLQQLVFVSVYDYSHTTGYEAAYERNQQLQCYKGRKNNAAILLHSRDMA